MKTGKEENKMAASKVRLDLSKIPFGRSRSRFMVFEENNCDREDRRAESGKPIPQEYPVQAPNHNDEDFPHGLYFAMCAQAGAAPRRRGLVDIVPTYDGRPIPYTYTATPSQLCLDTSKGSVRLVIDTNTTFRMTGCGGLGVRMYLKLPFLSMMSAQLMPSGIVELNLRSVYAGGGVMFFKKISGEITLDAPFDPLLNGPAHISVEFAPDENGVFEVAAYGSSPDEWGYISYKPFDECVASAEKSYEEFLAKFPAVPEKYRSLTEVAAYAMWLHYQAKSTTPILPTLKADMIYTDLMREGQARAFEQPIFSMALEDPEAAFELITNNFAHMANGILPTTISDSMPYYAAFPPTFGIAALRLLEIGGDKLAKEKLAALYENMSAHYEWWVKSHSLAPNKLSYNTRGEYGFTGASYGTLPFPLETPDLYAYMALYTEALARLSAIAGDGKTAQWQDTSRRLTETLLGLWDGERKSFACRCAISGEKASSMSALTYLPIILGERLPDEIINALAEALGDENVFLSRYGLRSESKKSEYYDPAAEGRGAIDAVTNMLIIGGLFDAGKTELAKTAATRLLSAYETISARDTLAGEGEQPARRPGNEFNAISGAAISYLASKLLCGKEE
jgi:hypothetical protein